MERGHMGEVPEQGQAESSTEKRSLENVPPISVFLIRHGETGKDKTNPKRALTGRGEEQVKTATRDAVEQIISEACEGEELDDDSRRELLTQLKFRLYDSGTTRTLQQIDIEREVLISMGVPEANIYLPDSYYQYKEQDFASGPGIPRRLEGVAGLDEHSDFRQKIGDPEYQAAVGATDEVLAWALTPEEEIPEGVSTPTGLREKVDRNLAQLKRIAPMLAKRDDRTVVIANSHASNVTMATAEALGIEDISDLGMAGNAEGVRMSFYADGRSTARAFGEDYEQKTGSSVVE